MKENKSFWTTLPGILTGMAGLIVAITGMYISLSSTNKDEISPGAQPKSPPSSDSTTISPSDWPLISEETFTKELAGWNIGNFPTEETPRFDLRVVEGKYRWDIEYNGHWNRWVISPTGSAIDFKLGVDVKMTEFTPETSANLLFGSAGNQNYIFSISSNRFFGLSRYDGVNTRMIIDWTPIPVEFNPNEWNRMGVVVDNQQIKLYLNSKIMGEYRDVEFTGGKAGLGVEMYQKGTAIIDFDNFELRRKPQ